MRRGFHEALAESKLAAWFVHQIGLLYEVEKRLREKKAGPRLRAAMRNWQSRPVLERLRRAMERYVVALCRKGYWERPSTTRLNAGRR